MPVVSNTSPILNLAIIGCLDLLRQQFGQVWIPPAVLAELRVEADLPGSRSVQDAMEAGWIEVEEVNEPRLVTVLRRDLHEGEAEAIALASQMDADWVLLDEREGRRVAQSLGLQVTGVLGVLLRAHRCGSLPSLRGALEQLRDEAGFRLGADLFSDILRQSADQ